MNFLSKHQHNLRLTNSVKHLICYISGKPLENSEIAFAYYNPEYPSVTIHKKYNNEKLRKEWMKHCKEDMKETTIRCLYQEDPIEIIDYIDLTFPRI